MGGNLKISLEFQLMFVTYINGKNINAIALVTNTL